MVKTITSTPHTVLNEVRRIGKILQGVPEVTKVTTGSFNFRGRSSHRKIRVVKQETGPWTIKVICPEGTQFLFLYTKRKKSISSLKKLLKQAVPNFQLV